MSDLLRRQRALEKTLGKYRGKAFARGRYDCITMLRSHLVAMGHKGLPKVPTYRNAAQAKAALAKVGHENIESLLDAILVRISPAAAQAGDVVLMRGEDELDAVMIKVGARKVMGWWGGYDETVIVTPAEVMGAWRA